MERTAKVYSSSGKSVLNPSAPNQTELPELFVDEGSLPATAKALGKYFARSPELFQRGSEIVKLVRAEQGASSVALSSHGVVNEAHAVCRPVIWDDRKGKMPVTLPQRVANLFLSSVGQWQLRMLRGIGLAPRLVDDGSIGTASGYDSETGFWFETSPFSVIPQRPSRKQAEGGLCVDSDDVFELSFRRCHSGCFQRSSENQS